MGYWEMKALDMYLATIGMLAILVIIGLWYGVQSLIFRIENWLEDRKERKSK